MKWVVSGCIRAGWAEMSWQMSVQTTSDSYIRENNDDRGNQQK